jgi:hypothetical protein
VQCIGEKMSSPSRSVQSRILQCLQMQTTPGPRRGRVFYCKGNPTTLR